VLTCPQAPRTESYEPSLLELMTSASFRSSHCRSQGAVGGPESGKCVAQTPAVPISQAAVRRSSLYSSLHALIFTRVQINSKPARVQALVPQLSVESFHKRVSAPAVRLNVYQFRSSVSHRPRQKMPRCKLRPVCHKRIASGNRVLQRSDPTPASLAGSPKLVSTSKARHSACTRSITLQHAELPSALPLHRAQNPKPTPGSLPSPHFAQIPARTKRFFLRFRRINNPASRYTRYTFLWFTCHPLRLQLHLATPVIPTSASLAPPQSALRNASSFRRLTYRLAGLRHIQQLRRSAAGSPEIFPQPARFLLALYELHPFFSITVSASPCPDSDSATSFLQPPVLILQLF